MRKEHLNKYLLQGLQKRFVPFAQSVGVEFGSEPVQHGLTLLRAKFRLS